MAGRQLKRYHIATIDADIEDRVQRAAYAQLPALLPEPDGETPAASFVVLHRGAGPAAYLCAYSWVWGNVIEYRTAAAAYRSWAARTRIRRISSAWPGRGSAAYGSCPVRP